MTILNEIYAVLFGLTVGSFANVCIYRLPRDRSIVSPRSMCPRCGTRVRFYDNIPVLSFLILRGKCRQCGLAIPVRYLFIELLLGITAYCFYRRLGLSLQGVYFFSLTSALIIASAIDLEHRIIPNVISISGIVSGLIAAALATWLRIDWPVYLIQAFTGAVLGAGLLWLVGWLYETLTGREGIGFGDVKLLALFGAHSGVSGVLTSLFYGSLFGSLVGIALMIFQGKGSRYPIPFGPFLCLGLLVYFLDGNRWISFLLPF